MDRRPPSYQPSSAADSEDCIEGCQPSNSRRLAGNRTYKQWYDAATATPFPQHRHRRLRTPVDSSNSSALRGTLFARSSEPMPSISSLTESFPSVEEVRVASTEVEDSFQKLRYQRNSEFSISTLRPQIELDATAHNFPENPFLYPSTGVPIFRPQDTALISTVPYLPKKRPLSLSSTSDEASFIHSKHPRSNRNARDIAYAENVAGVPLPSSCNVTTYTPEHVKCNQQKQGDLMNDTSGPFCENLSVSRHSLSHRDNALESDLYGPIRHSICNPKRHKISGTGNFNTISSPFPNFDLNLKGSQTEKERMQESVFHQHISYSNKELLTHLPLSASNSSQDLIPQPYSIYPLSEGTVNCQYNYEGSHPLSGSTFNISTNPRSNTHLYNFSKNSSSNLPQKDSSVDFRLHPDEIHTRSCFETESVNLLKTADNVANCRNPTLVQGSIHQSSTKLICDRTHTSNLSTPSNSNNFSKSLLLPTYEVPSIRQQASFDRNTTLNFTAKHDSRLGFQKGNLLNVCGPSSNNESSENSNSSQSLSTSPTSQNWSVVSNEVIESASSSENCEKSAQIEKSLHNRSVKKVEFVSSEICELKSQDKMKLNSVTDTWFDVTSKKVLHQQPSPNDNLPMAFSSSSKNKTQKSAETSRRRRRRAIGLVCGVCGDSARSLHFGGVSCDSCKAFFRRAVIAKAYPSFLCVTTGLSPTTELQSEARLEKNITGMGGETDSISAENGYDPKCVAAESRMSSLHGNCKSVADTNTKTKDLQTPVVDTSNGGRLKNCPPITITTRKYCQSCRFQKCIDIGMEISWVTLESDANRRAPEHDTKSNASTESSSKQVFTCNSKGGVKFKDDDQTRKIGEKDPSRYLTKNEQKQIENLVDIHRSIFWGVPEPVYYRPALIDFPPAFLVEDIPMDRNRTQRKECEHSVERNDISSHNQNEKDIQSENFSSSKEVNNESTNILNPLSNELGFESNFQPLDAWHTDDPDNSHHLCFCSKKSTKPLESESSIRSETTQTFGHERDHYDNQSSSYMLEQESQLSRTTIENICSLPRNPLGVNMYRKALSQRPRPWLIRQLMGYTLRFMYVVVKILQSVGRTLSVTDRTILLRQGMTRLTFLNSVLTYDTSIEAWPERIFPPLPLVLQEGESGSISEQPDYLQGIAMHPDEVATVVDPLVLEHQLSFIRGIKVLIGSDFPSMFLLMAIMLFDSTEEGLEHPEVVEQIQSNYCYLLKQYLSWKFSDGPPPNPGDERPLNFSDSPRTIGRQSGSSDPGPSCSNEPRNEDSNSKSSAYTFEKQEGFYFSPPYPPSPLSPKAIFPLLLTKLADLQQTAHNYSSTPFILQGPEVDEIGNLVARIQVFMSDVLETGPSSVDDDEGGNGDSGGMGGNTGFQESESDDDKVPRKTKSREGKDSNKQKTYNGKENLNQLFGKDEIDWIASSGQDLSWDSCSSADDETYSGSSLSVMSIGGSIDDIVGALITSDEGKAEMQRDSDENFIQSLEIWDEGGSIKFPAEAGDESLGSVNVESYCENKSLPHKQHVPHNQDDVSSKYISEGSLEFIGGGSHPEKFSSLNSQFILLNSSSIGLNKSWIEESIGENADTSGQIVQKEQFKDYSNELKAEVPEKEGSGTSYQRMETSGFRGITKREASLSCNNVVFEETKRNSCSVQGRLTDASTDAKNKNKAMPNRSLWDSLKATGRALLGFGSPQTDLKSRNDPLHSMTSTEDEKYLNNLLDHVERPESNSSGYVSSPSPLSMMKDFDPFHKGADWEDLFQKL